MKRLVFFTLLFLALQSIAQNSYTDPIFNFREEKNVVYGMATDFAGNTVSLVMDIFKPLGDDNLKRPVYLHFHGGGWLEISNKEQAEGRWVCQEMARRGYLAANVEYRRGYHRLPNYDPYVLCRSMAFPNKADCIYALDTSEIYRAVFRAMQDAKGAIRFLKNRHEQDSTDAQNVFVGGESAGGFVALAAAFLDCESEKSPACRALPDAPLADPDLNYCYSGVVNRTRPDLGSIEGTLNFGGDFDAQVKGVANFFGGVFHNLLLRESGDMPAAYFFHPTNDVVVDCGCRTPFASFFELFVYPLNLCQPFTTAPEACGSCAMRDFVNSNPPNRPLARFEIVNNGPPNVLADPPGHAYDNLPLRAGQMADFFSPIILGQTQLPTPAVGCPVSAEETQMPDFEAIASPNPFDGAFSVRLFSEKNGSVALRLSDVQGREILRREEPIFSGENSFRVETDVPPGVYFFEISMAGKRRFWKLVR